MVGVNLSLEIKKILAQKVWLTLFVLLRNQFVVACHSAAESQAAGWKPPTHPSHLNNQ